MKRSFLEDRSFSGLDVLNAQLSGWLDSVANVRVHGTTGERPVDRHAHEPERLLPLSSLPRYDTRPVELWVVHRDSHIRYQGVDPHLAIGFGLKAIEQGHRVYFLTLHDLVAKAGPPKTGTGSTA